MGFFQSLFLLQPELISGSSYLLDLILLVGPERCNHQRFPVLKY